MREWQRENMIALEKIAAHSWLCPANGFLWPDLVHPLHEVQHEVQDRQKNESKVADCRPVVEDGDIWLT